MKKLKNLVNLENICLSCLLIYIIICSIYPKYFKYFGISIEIVSVFLILVISYIERTKKEIETYKSKIENYHI